MNNEMRKKENQRRILSIHEMMLIKGGTETPQKPKTPGEVIIQPFR